MSYKNKSSQIEYQRQWVAQRRATFFENKICVWCGSTEKLELDHADADAKVSHNVWSWTKLRRDAELSKCQILCQNCHKVKTIQNHERCHGENKPNSILTERLVLEIRDRWNTGSATKRGMAREYKVSEHTIRMIISKKRWTHI